MSKLLLSLLLILAPLATLWAADDTSQAAVNCDIRYVKEHLLMQKGDEVNVVDVDLEWPNIIDGQNVAKLRHYIARHLFQTDGETFNSTYHQFLKRFGTAVTRQFDSIPDDHKFCYATIRLKNLYYVPGRYISFQLQSLIEPLSRSSQTSRAWQTLVTYDITRDSVLTIRNLLKESGKNDWRKDAWHFELNINRDDYVTMDVPRGCMADEGKMLLVTRQWEHADDGTPYERDYSLLCDLTYVRQLLSKDAKYLTSDKLWPIHPQQVADSILGYTPQASIDTHRGDREAKFKGGNDSLQAFVSRNLHYPKADLEKQVRGTVVVKFLVDRDGQVREPRVVRPLSPTCDREAIRVLTMMPKWMPAVSEGKAADMVYTMPVKFKLH